MTRKPNSGRPVVTMLAVLVLLLAVTPALARGGHGKSRKARGATATRTEDNDNNDGGVPNNVPDAGDNAHPSGKDRSVEHGPGNQGNSRSNPDDSKGPMRHEGDLGADTPDGPGGSDLADQDGNNGCGNDDDFDDDNNGWCGKPPHAGGNEQPPVDTPPPAGDGTPLPPRDDDNDNGNDNNGNDNDNNGNDNDNNGNGNDNNGNDNGNDNGDDDVLGGGDEGDDVLGDISSDVPLAVAGDTTAPAAEKAPGAALPFTGVESLLTYVLLGLSLTLIGGVTFAIAKR